MNKLKYLTVLVLSLFIYQANAQMQGQGGFGGGGYGNGQGQGSGGGRHRSDMGMDDDGNPRNEKPDAEQLAKMQTSRMQKELNLTPEQNTKVGEINLNYAKQIEEQIRSTPEMTDYTRAMIIKLRKTQNEELKTVLTEEQWQTYQKKDGRSPG